jgi:hypothetical protein
VSGGRHQPPGWFFDALTLIAIFSFGIGFGVATRWVARLVVP